MSLTELFFRPFLSHEEGLPLFLSPSSVARLAQVGSTCSVPYNLSNWCWCSLITPKKGDTQCEEKGRGPAGPDRWLNYSLQLPCEVRIFFWLRIVQKQIVVSLSARYIHVLMQACMSSGTLVHFAFQLLVQRYSFSKINWLNHLQIKSNKQVIINVLGFTQSPGLCAYRNFSRKIKEAPQVSLHVFGS